MNETYFYISCPCCNGALTVKANLDQELYWAEPRHPFFQRWAEKYKDIKSFVTP